ncbi:MAG: segregation/condensation protein A [Sphaerospermopsis sp. SIO1G1]|nr:segregation/condensation protein A [Sphaerospermopsis sp. SIO1G1]
MDQDHLLAAITNLIEQAEQGEIDPWDVQVIEVIDRYLELMSPETTMRGYEKDLSQSGQAFLSASMLVLFKANTLTQLSSVDSTIDNVSEDAMWISETGELLPIPRLQLERQLRRRPAAMPPPKRRVTLQELIEQLQIMANQLKRVEKISKPQPPKRQPTMKKMREALELAHQENLTEVASELEQVLQLSAQELNLTENSLNLEQLVQMWQQTKPLEHENSHHDSETGQLVSIFWALLLLSAQSKVELYQEEFYQEVKIRLLTNSVEDCQAVN